MKQFAVAVASNVPAVSSKRASASAMFRPA
jgi:hypothetical protein